MLVMVVFFIAFRWIHLSTPLIRLFLLVLILLLMPTLNFLPVWFALSLLRFRLPKANQDRKSGSAGMPRPISYAVFCLKKKSWTHGLPPDTAYPLPNYPAPPARCRDSTG